MARQNHKLLRRSMGHWGEFIPTREFFRGLFHYSVGIAGWWMIQIVGISLGLMGLIIVSVSSIVFVFEYWRRNLTRSGIENNRGFLSWLSRTLTSKLYRDSEKYKFGNTIKSFLGLSTAWLVCWLVDVPWVAGAVCMIFGSADPFAKFGKIWPIRRLYSGKSWGGFIYGVIASVVSCSVILYLDATSYPILPANVSTSMAFFVYFVGALTASFFELIDDWKLYNFLIPATSSIAMVVVYRLFGG
ncbi:MAG: hypothetical protein ABIJ23_03555 [Candidatus Magasanikbacteria bacterium]